MIKLYNIKRLFIILYCLASLETIVGQVDSMMLLPQVVIAVDRINSNVSPLPQSTAKFDSAAMQSTAINEYLTSMAGIFTMSATNFAQDTRITSRGFGARSGFGIRGLRIYADELPLTTPDGQTQVDDVPLSAITAVTFLRGPYSGVYGNNSGGVIDISTGLEPNGITLGYTFGSFGLNQAQVKYTTTRSNYKLLIAGSHLDYKGYRTQSEFKNTILYCKAIIDLSANWKMTIIAGNATSPKAQDPGALTLEELDANRTAARDVNTKYDAGEAVTQERGGIILKKFKNNRPYLSIKTNGTYRNFENKLPLNTRGYGFLSRYNSGVTLEFLPAYYINRTRVTHNLGVDFETQRDRRSQFQNENGSKGDLGLEQDESFNNAAFFALSHIDLSKNIFSDINLRYDRIMINLKDLYQKNGDQSGSKNFSTLNYNFIFGYRTSSNQVSLIHSSGFESPTLSEYSNNPTLSAGFNTSLLPMKSLNYELNFKQHKNRSICQSSIFFIRTSNEIIPFDIKDQIGRTFYKNAGLTQRIGFEFEYAYTISKNLNFRSSYSLSKFQYKDFGLYTDRYLPGIPMHQGYLGLQWSPKNFDIRFDNNFASKIYTSDTNLLSVNNQVSNIVIAYRKKIKKTNNTFALGINNLWNSRVYSNIRINAANLRYFEVGLPRNIFIKVMTTI